MPKVKYIVTYLEGGKFNGKPPETMMEEQAFIFKMGNLSGLGVDFTMVPVEPVDGPRHSEKQKSHIEFMKTLSEEQKSSLALGEVKACYSSEGNWYLKAINEDEIHISISPVTSDETERKAIKKAILNYSGLIYKFVVDEVGEITEEQFNALLKRVTFIVK